MKTFCLALLIFSSLRLMSQDLKAGHMIRVRCANDSNNQYSLYLPVNYEPGIKYPLILFLDPMARGNVPVEKYRAVADEQGVILAGSFESRNFDPAASVHSVTAILNDIVERIKPDETRIWLAGFSGGARMAATYALGSDRISGVVGCGAGFADNDLCTNKITIPFAGIIGYRDMNFEELSSIKDLLAERKKENILLLFDGGHQWPPVQQLAIAVMWLNRTGNSQTVTSKDLLSELDRLRQKELSYLAWLEAREYRKIPSLTAPADSMISSIEHTKGFAKSRESFESSLNEEREYMDGFSFLFSQFVLTEDNQPPDDEVWKQKASKVASFRESKNSYRQLSGERLFDFSWRLCIEQYQWLMESKRFKQAYKAAHLLLFYPAANLDPDLLMASAAAGAADEPRCLQHLKQSIKKQGLGKEKILQDKLITGLIGKEGVERLFDN
jgi:predicted esterase